MRWGFAITAIALWLATTADAQMSTGPVREDHRLAPPLARLDLLYSVSARGALLNASSLNVTYGGLGANHLRLGGAYFSSTSRFGGFGDLAYEWFSVTGRSLLDADTTLAMRGIRLALGGAARFQPTRAVSLEAQLGYGYERVPVADATGAVVRDASFGFHGPVLGGVAHFARSGPFGFGVSLRVMPFSFRAASPLGTGAARALTLGGHMTIAAFQLKRLRMRAMLDYELSLASVRGGGGAFSLSQGAHRLGLGFRLALPDPRSLLTPTGPGLLRGRAVFADNQAPVPNLPVQLADGTAVTTDANGRFRIEQVTPGRVVVQASTPGYRPFQRELAIAPAEEVELNIALERPTGPGVIRGVVFMEDPKAEVKRSPLANATVELPGRPPVTTGADGRFVVESAGPGPVALKFQSKGFRPSEEAVSVPPEGEAQLEVVLRRQGARALATLRGRVRSISGQTVAAVFSIPEAKIQTRTDKQGRFQLRVPGGRYTVHFEADGFFKQTKVVEVADGDQTLFYIDLTPSE